MTEPPPGLADVHAHSGAGKQMLASDVDSRDYEWQRQVGSWYIAADALVDAAATQELRRCSILRRESHSRSQPKRT
jgi:hypothetical protein